MQQVRQDLVQHERIPQALQQQEVQLAVLEQAEGAVRLARKARSSRGGGGSANGIKNRTIFIADNLHVMRGMPDKSVDLIYLDPPFNKNKNFSAPIGSKAAGAEFKDTWTLSDVDEVWWGEIASQNEALYTVLDAINKTAGEDLMSYSIYMAIRLLEMHRILKETGSLYLHCDPTASHYLKIILDAIFGSENFRNEIIWKRVSSHNDAKRYGKIHDVLHFYSKDASFCFNTQYVDYSPEYVSQRFKRQDEDGRRYNPGDLTAKGLQGGGYEYEYQNRRSLWRVPLESMKRLHKQDRLYFTKKSIYIKKYLDELPGIPMGDVITDVAPINSQAKERMGYPTQKPLTLIERIIKASSNEGEVVLDPFCGCATTCIASEKLNRQWIGIDISKMALNLIKRRLHDEYPLDQYTKKEAQLIPLTKPPILQGTQSKNIKDLLYGKQHGHCAGCDVHFPYRNLTIDHIIPTSKGGADIDENKQLLCQSCNSMKGNRMTTTELKAKLARLGIGK